MYSITDRDSLSSVEKYKSILHRLRGTERPVVLIANKCDMLSARCVAEEDGVSLSTALDCPLFELSVAEEHHSVTEAVDELIVQIRRDHVKSMSAANVMNLDKPRSKLFNMRRVLKKRIGRSHSDTF